jgi:hypothetical protein
MRKTCFRKNWQELIKPGKLKTEPVMMPAASRLLSPPTAERGSA